MNEWAIYNPTPLNHNPWIPEQSSPGGCTRQCKRMSGDCIGPGMRVVPIDGFF